MESHTPLAHFPEKENDGHPRALGTGALTVAGVSQQGNKLMVGSAQGFFKTRNRYRLGNSQGRNTARKRTNPLHATPGRCAANKVLRKGVGCPRFGSARAASRIWALGSCASQ